MALYGYARVSTADQDCTLQEHALRAAGCEVIRAEKVGADTMLSRIVEMVAKAQRSRAPIQGLADRVSFYFVPTVVLIAIIAFVVWALFGPDPSMVYAIVSAVSRLRPAAGLCS